MKDRPTTRCVLVSALIGAAVGFLAAYAFVRHFIPPPGSGWARLGWELFQLFPRLFLGSLTGAVTGGSIAYYVRRDRAVSRAAAPSWGSRLWAHIRWEVLVILACLVVWQFGFPSILYYRRQAQAREEAEAAKRLVDQSMRRALGDESPGQSSQFEFSGPQFVSPLLARLDSQDVRERRVASAGLRNLSLRAGYRPPRGESALMKMAHHADDPDPEVRANLIAAMSAHFERLRASPRESQLRDQESRHFWRSVYAAMCDPEATVRRAAAEAFLERGRGVPPANGSVAAYVPALVEQAESGKYQAEALRVLQRLGPDAASGLKTLSELLQRETRADGRAQLAVTIHAIDARAVDLMPTLEEVISQLDGDLLFDAVQVLVSFNGDHPGLAEASVRLVKNRRTTNVKGGSAHRSLELALELRKRLEYPTETAMRFLIEVARHPAVTQEGFRTAWQGIDVKLAVDRLIEAIRTEQEGRSTKWDVRRTMIAKFAWIESERVTPALVGLLEQSDDAELTRMVASALSQRQDAGEEAIAALLRLTSPQTEDKVALAAALAIVQIDPGHAEALSTLQAVFSRTEREQADLKIVLWALGGLVERAGPCIPFLAGLLDELNPYVRSEVAATLGRLRATARPAIPKLVAVYKNEKNGSPFKEKYLTAIREIDPNAAAGLGGD
jgi:hypothetical protein